MDVVLVRWPAEAERRSRLAAGGVARLLIVDGDADPPAPFDCLEDWIRVPAPEADVRARVSTLSARVAAHRVAIPSIDGDGVLRFGGGWVALAPVEGRLAAALLDRFGAVVGRDTLARAGWAAQPPGRNALDVHVLRLRRRLGPLGLVIRTVRSRGYMLEAAEAVAREA